jgi:hypothetical protein
LKSLFLEKGTPSHKAGVPANHYHCLFLILAGLNILIMLSGCSPYSTQIRGNDDSMNSGFEIVKKGLPVNWYFYTPDKVPESDFNIVVDTVNYKEGKQSLKFVVRKCTGIGGWKSPGFFEDFSAKTGETYKVSFWMMNQGCHFQVRIGSSEYMVGSHEETIIASKDNIDEWKYFEYNFTVHYDRIRFEVNILSPGSIWFDDISIEGINDKSPRNSLR